MHNQLSSIIRTIVSKSPDTDALQIAEALWLSQYMDSDYSKVEAQTEQTSHKPTPQRLPREVTHKVVISSSGDGVDEQGESSNIPLASFDREDGFSATYSAYIKKIHNYSNIAQRFRKLKIKQKHISEDALDEERSAEYIANTGLFHPIFDEVRSYKEYLHLVLIMVPSKKEWVNPNQVII
ncbi:MAG: hypothetical protein U9N49_01580 [Campylobacterota bacterium]|nr:hypothetical protein [Campylobacterota bacterium]